MRTLIVDAFIYTSDEAERTVPRGAILIDGARIVEIGPTERLADAVADLVIEAGGMVALPGLINCHTHATLTASRGDSDDLELFPWLVDNNRRSGPAPTAEDARYSCYLGCLEMLRGGVTYAVDCGRYEPTVYARVARELGQRCLSGAMANSEELRPGAGNWPEIYDQTRRALAELPEDAEGMTRYFLGAHAPYSCTPERLREAKRGADELGLPFNIHLAESQDELDVVMQRHGVTPLRLAYDLGLLDERTILNHCVQVGEDEVPLLAQTGAKVAHCPISNAKLASGVASILAFREHGIAVGLGTDSTVSNNTLNMYEEMKFGVLVQRALSRSARRVTARDALAMATREAAAVVGMADQIGSLEIGKRADLQLVALDHPRGLTARRVRSDLVWATRPDQVRWVLVNGEVVVEDGRLTRVDEVQIRERARTHFAARETETT